MKFYGEGVYLGDRVPDIEPFRSSGIRNPCIRLDDGTLVWGFQCWWGPVKAVEEIYGPMKREQVPVNPIVEIYLPEPNRTSVAFQTGNKFRFPGERRVCTFQAIQVVDGENVILFDDEKGKRMYRIIQSLTELQRV